MSIVSDSKLMIAAAEGDISATGLLLLKIRPRTLAYVERHLPRELSRVIEPADIVQDTNIEAIRRIGSFSERGEDSFFRWVVTIARSQMLQALRARRSAKRGKGLTRGSSATDLIAQLAACRRTPSQSAEGHELAVTIEQCLDLLPTENARVIRLRHLENLSWDDIATRMGKTEGSVLMLCNRGMKELRKHLRSLSRFA